MAREENPRDQLIGQTLPDWTARKRPPESPMEGRTCRLEPLRAATHGDDLYREFSADTAGRNWTYLGYGPFASRDEFGAWAKWAEDQSDPQFHTVIEPTSGRALGVASFLRMQPEDGVVEIGHIHFAPALQGSTPATEALHLMMKRVFDELGYRRCEWKCDALNAPSMRAAKRLGFRFEGTFRQAMVYKGRNRDTAWFSILDREWPALREALEAWLAPANFDAQGAQKRSLESLRPGSKA